MIKSVVDEKLKWQDRNLTKAEKKLWKEQNLVQKIGRHKKSKTVGEQQTGCTSSTETSESPTERPLWQPVSTVSIALPGSILRNAQSAELRTYLAGQIARAACIFQVDEVVIYDDRDRRPLKNRVDKHEHGEVSASCLQLGRILQYLECPQYLRKHLFPLHSDLKYAGLLNPLDAPHHLREYNDFVYREGVVTNKPIKTGRGSLVNVGLKNDVSVDKMLIAGVRCTVRLEPSVENKKPICGTLVAPTEPRNSTGIYWGYTVRIAHSMSQVFLHCPYNKGYDVTIGTSDRGESIDDMPSVKYEHALVMFGGIQGIEAALEYDNNVLDVKDPRLLFDHYLNTLPNQGSRTIRTEEAVLVTMAALRTKLSPRVAAQSFVQSAQIAQSADN